MPKVKTAAQRAETKHRVELHFNDKENKAIEAKVKKYNAKNKGKKEITRKEYLQMLANADAKKK